MASVLTVCAVTCLFLCVLSDSNRLIWDNDTSINQWPGSSANVIAQSFTETEFLAGRCDAAAATRYNELALVLEAVNPRTGALYTEQELFVFDYLDYNISTFEDNLFASRAWLADPANRDIAVRFLRASTKGWLYQRDFPVQTNNAVFNGDVHQRWMGNEVSKLIFPGWEAGFGVAPDDVLQMSADRAFKYRALSSRALVSDFWRSDIALEAQRDYDSNQTAATLGAAGSGGLASWGADPELGILGSSDVLGLGYAGPEIRFCFNQGQLAICEGVRTQDPADYLAASSGAGRAVLALGALALLVVAAVTALLIAFRAQKNIVAASLPFCLIIALGAAIFISSVFLATGVAETARCHARVWMMCIGFVLMMGSFVIKVRRIDAIFNSKVLTATKLTNDVLFQQVAGLLAVEVLLLGLFSGLSGLQRVQWDDVLDGRKLHTACQMAHPTSGNTVVGFLFAFKVLILLWAVHLSYATRNVTSAFNESRHLALSVYNLFFVSVVVVPVVAFMGLTVHNQLIVASIGIIAAVTLSFLLLFVPKVYHVCFSTLTCPRAHTLPLLQSRY